MTASDKKMAIIAGVAIVLILIFSGGININLPVERHDLKRAYLRAAGQMDQLIESQNRIAKSLESISQ